MSRLDKRLDPHYYWDLAEKTLAELSKEEKLAWQQHPCTQSLKLSLEGDISGITNLWISGAYSDEGSIDGTAQRQAKARGQAQAADNIITRIEEIALDEGESQEDDV